MISLLLTQARSDAVELLFRDAGPAYRTALRLGASGEREHAQAPCQIGPEPNAHQRNKRASSSAMAVKPAQMGWSLQANARPIACRKVRREIASER